MNMIFDCKQVCSKCRQSHDILAAPCLFCGYNGQGYWQRGTHHEQCPWRMIGGERERNEKLPELTRKLFVLGQAAEDYIDASPCDPDITSEQIEAYSDYLGWLSYPVIGGEK